MGDNVDSTNSEDKLVDNTEIVSSSSGTGVNCDRVEDSIQEVTHSGDVTVSSSEAEVAVSCSAVPEVDSDHSDSCVSSSSGSLSPSEGLPEEPSSSNTILEVSHENDDGCDSSNSVIKVGGKDVIDDVHDSADSVLETSCKDDVNQSTLVLDTVMDVCSSAAQHIKRTITEALKSRESVSGKLLEPDDFCVSLEANLKEKIADFEKTVEKTNSPTKESSASLSADTISPGQGSDTRSCEITQTQLDVAETNEASNEPSNNCSLAAAIAAVMNINSDDSSAVPVQLCSNEVAESKSVPGPEAVTVPEICGDSEKAKKSQKSVSVKKKGEKSVDQILKSLSNCSSPEEKLQTLCRKHIEVLEELRSNETRLKQCERQAVVALREKEQLQADHNRTILAKSRLESLCRELQRQNRAVKEESLLRIREEEEKRKDVANKFQTTLNDISNLMQDNSKKNLQLREENAELAKKLKSLVEHYEMWEQHMGKVLQQKDLEVQLAKAKLAKTNLQLKQETEKFLREKKDLLETMSELQKKCTELASNEVQLRTELSVYTSKYEEFQSVLNKSNQVFASFKTDMDTTSKKIKKLEKETNVWKTKWENSNGALIEMIADKQKRDKELLNAQQRVLMLEKLCRALQAERNDLQSQIKDSSNTGDTTSNSEDTAATPIEQE